LEANNLIDGVTYGKGTCFVKQLHHFIGFENFKRSLQRYIALYQYKNSTLEDFIKCLDWALSEDHHQAKAGLTADFDLKKWCHYWLFTPGINGLEPLAEWNDDESLKSLSVKQTLVFCDNCKEQNILRK